MNANPHKARLARRQARKPGDMPALLLKLWNALLDADDVRTKADDPDLRLRACHAISQIGGQYCKLLEVGELEARLALLEAKMGGGTPYAY